jgi:dihydroxy-acid dehydratase
MSPDCLVEDAEWERRRGALTPPETPDWARRGYGALFNRSIQQADEGCDFDFMAGTGAGSTG